jgi:mRNA interferase MazF
MTRASLAVGDVVLVVFPFAGGGQSKRRPALVMSAVDAYGDHLIVPITSNPGAADTIALTHGDMEHGALAKDSWIKALKLNPVPGNLIERVVGKVKPAILAQVHGRLCPALGCR